MYNPESSKSAFSMISVPFSNTITRWEEEEEQRNEKKRSRRRRGRKRRKRRKRRRRRRSIPCTSEPLIGSNPISQVMLGGGEPLAWQSTEMVEPFVTQTGVG